MEAGSRLCSQESKVTNKSSQTKCVHRRDIPSASVGSVKSRAPEVVQRIKQVQIKKLNYKKWSEFKLY